MLLLFNEAVLDGGKFVANVSEQVASAVVLGIVPKIWVDSTPSTRLVL